MSKADPAIVQYGAVVLLRLVNALVGEVEGVRLARDPEHLHRMRVATRRLREALPLFAPSISPRQADAWQRDVRRLTRALGPARDTDVQMEFLRQCLQTQPPHLRAGIRRLLLRLRQQRARMQAGVELALDEFERSSAAKKLQDTLAAESGQGSSEPNSPALYQLAWHSAREKLAAFLTFEPFVHQSERIEELHAMRIAAKHLRYTLEIFSALYPGGLKQEIERVKKGQTLLGDIHDCDVWLFGLPAFRSAEERRTVRYFGHSRPFQRLLPGLQAFEADRRQERDRLYEAFVSLWDGWQADKVWLQLSTTLQPSCSEPEEEKVLDEDDRADR